MFFLSLMFRLGTAGREYAWGVMVISFHFSHKSSKIRVEAVETTAVHAAVKKTPCDFHPSHGRDNQEKTPTINHHPHGPEPLS
jgi:hypothetical protein